jgi:pimeloyl-ACP methyl ester carboxylesterase
MSEAMASLNGIEMHYEIHGEGEPLVLLHGFTGIGRDWQSFVPDLCREYRLIVPDLRGHGLSTNPAGEFTHRQSALDVFALLDQLGIETFRAIGVSCGGNNLLHMATRQPRRVEAMVIASATPCYPEPARAVMRRNCLDRLSPAEWEFLRQRHPQGDEQIRALWAQGNGFKDSYDDMNFTPPLLSTITARTLIVSGDRDPLYPPRIALEMHEAIPGSHLWIVPNGGHGPIWGPWRDRFLETAAGFLRGTWPPPAALG